MVNRNKAAIIAGLILSSTNVFGEIVYSSIPSPLPPNVNSVGYQSNQISEFGNAITLAGSNRVLNSIDVIMSNWALESTYETVGTSTGYYHDLTLNLYNTGSGNSVGSLITTQTISAFIQWRPENSIACAGNNGYSVVGDSNCYHGIATNVQFDFSSGAVVLPDTLIFGLAYNTSNYGAAPIHAGGGPYDSLNIGAEGSPTIGSNVHTDGLYLNSATAAVYGDDPDQSTGTFRFNNVSSAPNQTWNGSSPEITIEATPEPGTFALLGGGFILLAAARRRMSRS